MFIDIDVNIDRCIYKHSCVCVCVITRVDISGIPEGTFLAWRAVQISQWWTDVRYYICIYV